MRLMTEAEKTLHEKREWMKDVAIKLLSQYETPYVVDGAGRMISAASSAAQSAKEMADVIFGPDIDCQGYIPSDAERDSFLQQLREKRDELNQK